MDTTTSAAFDAFYAAALSKLREFEKQRLAVMYKMLFVIVAVLAVVAALAWAMLQAQPPFGLPRLAEDPRLAIGVAIGAALALIYAWVELPGSYDCQAPVEILGDLVPAARPGLGYLGRMVGKGVDMRYVPAQNFGEGELREAGLFADLDFNEFRASGAVAGDAGDGAVRFAIVVLHERTYSRKHGSSSKKRWSGVVFETVRGTPFRGRTLVLPDTAERLLGAAGRSLQKETLETGERTTLADEAFEKRFVVYATDPAEAKAILSRVFTKRLVAYVERTGAKLRLAFVGDRVLVAMDGPEDYFEAPVFRSLLNPALHRATWDRIRTYAALGTDLALRDV